MSALLIAGAIVASIIAIVLIAGETAPYGYEDETGFHYGNPPMK